MEGYFSLLWENQESYAEWRRNLCVRDKGYIADLNLKYVYKEICRAGRFGERYGFEEIFLHPCARVSTVVFRQKIMKQLYEDSFLYEMALEFVSCIALMQKRMEALDSIKDEKKKMISTLQIRYEFMDALERIYEKTSGYIREKEETFDGTPLAEGVQKLGSFISGYWVVSEKAELSNFLSVLGKNMPCSVVLNKDRNQHCRSVVIDPKGTSECGYTERLMECARPFLGEYDFKVGVYQNTDITCLDKRIQNYICRNLPGIDCELENLYEKYGNNNLARFFPMAVEFVFYLSCIRFVREYEKAGFWFSIPTCAGKQDYEVRDAYDMTLGINLYQSGKGCRVVSNDYQFGEKSRVFILTGANQGGKTTFIRSIGLIQCLAQIGMFVPCRKASLGVAGQIHTHFSREDERGAAVGRFEQELQRVHEILESLWAEDMVLLNETFTSTQRSTAVILLRRLLLEMDHRQCYGGLVTHFYEVYDGLEESVVFSLTTEEVGEGKERTYKIREGESGRYSHARDIAAKCGVTYEELVAALPDESL